MRFAIRGVPRERRAISVARVVLDRHAEDAGGAADDRGQLLGLVVAEPEREPEAVAQRRRQQAGARRRAHERELRQVERQRPRRRPLADDDVEPEVLERRVEDLLDRAVDPVDLVDEEDVPQLERGQDRRHVALLLERGAGDRADADAELLADDLRERRLAEARRADEQDVVERLAARLRGGERDRELLLDALLADELVQPARAERALELLLVGAEDLGSDRAHSRLPQRQPDALLGREVGIDRRQRLLGLEHGPAELDERVARGQVHGRAGRARDRHGILGAELLLQLEHDPLGGLLADPRDRLEARGVLEHDRAAQVGGRRAGDDRERDLRPDPGHREQVQEELRARPLGEAVELERVLAHVQVGLDDDLAPALGGAHRAGRRGERDSRRR